MLLLCLPALAVRSWVVIVCCKNIKCHDHVDSYLSMRKFTGLEDSSAVAPMSCMGQAA